MCKVKTQIILHVKNNTIRASTNRKSLFLVKEIILIEEHFKEQLHYLHTYIHITVNVRFRFTLLAF